MPSMREILFSAPRLTDHVSDDWLLAFIGNRLAEPNDEKPLPHLLMCEQCCKLAVLHHEYQQITRHAFPEDEPPLDSPT